MNTTKIQNRYIHPITTQDGQTQPSAMIAGLNEILRKPVNPKTGMKIRRITRIIQQQAEDVEAERMRLLEQHAKKNADGEMQYTDEKKIAVALADPKAFTREFDELLDLDFEVEALTESDLEQLGSITPLTLINLGDLIIDSEAHTNGNTSKPAAAQKRAAKRKNG